MPSLRKLILVLCGFLLRSAIAQYTAVPFTSGPIPLCDTSTFTANVSGIGTLYPPGWNFWTYSLQQLLINITSDHPQTLVITLTSPEGTDLLLSAYNGAGGQNYTNTAFMYSGFPSITTGTAPFTGYWTAQGGGLSTFDYENANGTWTITVVDTACVNGGGGGGGGGGNAWTPGWFDGSTGGGGFGFAFAGPPPCWDPWAIQPGSAYLCPGESVDILGYYQNANLGFSYTVSSWNGPVPDPTAVTATGYYWVDAYDPWTGCTYTADFQVYASTPVVLGPDQTVTVCQGAAPVDLYDYFTLTNADYVAWSLNGTGITWSTAQNATTPGTYQLIADNYGGCGDTALITLTQGTTALLGPDQGTSTCAGSPADLTALFDLTGLSASWSLGWVPFATPQAALNAGAYTVVATSQAGCSDTAVVSLTVFPAPVLGADQALSMCENTTLDLTSLYPTAGLTTAWSQSGVAVANPGAVAASGAYQLVAASSAGCLDTALVTISTMASPVLGADATDVFCSSATVDLTSYFNTNNLTCSWTLSGAAVTDPAQVNVAGQYRLVATNASGCADSASVVLTMSMVPFLGPDQTVQVCSNATVDLASLFDTGTNAVAWTFGGNAIAPPASVQQPGLYTLNATNAEGCSSAVSVNLGVDQAPALGTDHEASICAGNSFDLTALFNTSGLVPVWSRNGLPVTNPAVVSNAGSYVLVAADAMGCRDTAMVQLDVNPAPDLGVDVLYSLCPWQTVDLQAVFPVAGLAPVYTLNDQPVSAPDSVHDEGVYIVSVVNAEGCTDTAAAHVLNVDCLCEADMAVDAHCLQDPARFKLIADSTVLGVQWEFGTAANVSTEREPLVHFQREGEVQVTMEATLACGVVRMERVIELHDCSDSCTVFIPNAFTPNGDGMNEAWSWRGECRPEDFIMRVYDRQGEEVFVSNDPQNEWDGTYAGEPAPPGVYVFKGSFRLPYQKRQEVIGAVTLLR